MKQLRQEARPEMSRAFARVGQALLPDSVLHEITCGSRKIVERQPPPGGLDLQLLYDTEEETLPLSWLHWGKPSRLEL